MRIRNLEVTIFRRLSQEVASELASCATEIRAVLFRKFPEKSCQVRFMDREHMLLLTASERLRETLLQGKLKGRLLLLR